MKITRTRRLLAAILAVILAVSWRVQTSAEKLTKPSIRDQLLAQKEAVDMHNVEHAVIIYFAGWHLGEENSRFGGEVAGLPWEQITYVNHAFWCVEPSDGSTETSFQRRASGAGARTQFHIVPLDADTDLGDCGTSDLVPGLPKNHFAQYAYFSEQYPDVNILISIGGWTKCGYFSEMAYTAEGRASFIASCMELMEAHPWIDGIDIDWEYPAGNRDGERQADPNDPGDQGCPIFGTASQDRENFALLLAELRSAMEARYGVGVKKLTACASGSTGWTLPCQDWVAAAPSLDRINIMSYDLAGIWDGVTGHASSAALAKGGAMYFKMQGIPVGQVCVGSPLYGTPFRMKEITRMPLGSKIEPQKPIATELCDQTQILQWESEAVSGYRIVCEDGKYKMGEKFDNGGTGWHMCYDDRNGGPYLYNDDESSPCYCFFISYENPLSLQMKLDYIQEKGIGGIIIWESSQDTADYGLLRQIHENLADPARPE